MATFDYTKAIVEEVYLRRILAGGVEKFEKQPYRLITFDDNSLVSYVEPEPALGYGSSNLTWNDAYASGDTVTVRILDYPPFNEVIQIR